MTADSQSPAACLTDCPKSSWAIMMGFMCPATKLSVFRTCKHLATIVVEHTTTTHVTIHRSTTSQFVLDLIKCAIQLDLTLDGGISAHYAHLPNKQRITHLTLRNAVYSKGTLPNVLQLQACTKLLQLTFHSCTCAGIRNGQVDLLIQQRPEWCPQTAVQLEFLHSKGGTWGIVKLLAPCVTHLSVMDPEEGICASVLSLCTNLTHFTTNSIVHGDELNELLTAPQLSYVVLGDLQFIWPPVNIGSSCWRSLEVLEPELAISELEHIIGLERLERFVLHGLSLNGYYLRDLDPFEECELHGIVGYLNGLAYLMFKEPGTVVVRQTEEDPVDNMAVNVAAAIAAVQGLIDSHRP